MHSGLPGTHALARDGLAGRLALLRGKPLRLLAYRVSGPGFAGDCRVLSALPSEEGGGRREKDTTRPLAGVRMARAGPTRRAGARPAGTRPNKKPPPAKGEASFPILQTVKRCDENLRNEKTLSEGWESASYKLPAFIRVHLPHRA